MSDPMPDALQRLIESGRGELRVEETEVATFYEHFISFAEVEAMSEEERAYYGLEAAYQLALEHRDDPPTAAEDDTEANTDDDETPA
jgi:hypothetical protein